MLRRTLSALLALLTVFSILPMAAFAAEDEAATEEYVVLENATATLDPNDVYYSNSSYYDYYWYETNVDESENNDSRSYADTLPVSDSKHIQVYGDVHSSSDSKDYFKIKVTQTQYLKLLCMSAFDFEHTQFRLYNSSGEVLKTAPYVSKWEFDSGREVVMHYMTYTLSPGTYYIRVYQPDLSGYSYVSGDYLMYVHLYPRLAKPSVSTTRVAATGKPVIEWDAVSGAEYYKVYRATSKSGTYSTMKTTTGTTYTDTSAKAGKTYYYKVQAFSDSATYAESNGQSSKSAAATRTCDCARPEITVTQKASTGKNVISWNDVAGADSYKVYYSTSKSGSYTLLKTTAASSYTHTGAKAGKTYYYKVKATISDKSAATSAYSLVKSGICDCERPSVTITRNSKGKPYLNWDNISGAYAYEIYYSTSKSGPFELLKTNTASCATHSNAKAGVTYYYRVKALNETRSSADSALSTVKSIKSK